MTSAPADLGNVYAGSSGGYSNLTSTVIHSVGGLAGRIISRGNLISAITAGNSVTGIIATQGDLGAYASVAGNTIRGGGLTSYGSFSGQLIVLGNAIGNIALNGGLRNGDIAVKGSILGNLLINGGLDGSSAIVAGGAIGNPSTGTVLTIRGSNAGIIAAGATIRYSSGSLGGLLFPNATGPNAAAISAIFTDGGQPLALDVLPGDLQGLALIDQDLLLLRVTANGTLGGPVA